MNSRKVSFSKIFLLLISLSGCFALIAQFYLIIANRTASVAETVTRYFSFFTILTNLLVIICSTILFFGKDRSKNTFFYRPQTIAAIAVYITVVGLVYNLILRFLWQPQGLQFVVDELLHTIIPILFILFWLLFVPKSGLRLKDIFPWLLYPFFYIIYILIRGAFSGFYPYPFINVNELGYNKVFLNSGILVAVFVVFSLLFVVIGNLIIRRSNLTNSN
ncbi:MAG: Pr6Pr family membrane protein [Ginsengibacter sp.]